MDTAAAPVSLKGSREPLLLIGTGFLLSTYLHPIPCMIGAAGIALGMHDLRKCEAGQVLGRQRVVTEISAWCACGLSLTFFFWQALLILWPIAYTFSVFSSAVALMRIARAAGAVRLSHSFHALAWTPILFVALSVVPLPALTVLAYGLTCLTLAVLTLRLRTLALPYGKRLVHRAS